MRNHRHVWRQRRVRIETVPDARSIEPTDALVTVTPRLHLRQRSLAVQRRWTPGEHRSSHGTTSSSASSSAVGSDVRTLKPATSSSRRSRGRTAPASSVSEGLHDVVPARWMVGWYGARRRPGRGGACPAGGRHARRRCLSARDDALMPSLLTLSDVMGTGHHAARAARVGPGEDRSPSSATAPSASAASSPRTGVRRRTDHSPGASSGPNRAGEGSFGATDIVSERGEEAVARVRGADRRTRRPLGSRVRRHRAVAMRTAIGIARPGGAVGRVGVPHYEAIPASETAFYAQRHRQRRPRPGPRVHRRAASRTFWKAGSSPAESSIGSSALTTCPTGMRAMNERDSIKGHGEALMRRVQTRRDFMAQVAA